MKIRDCMKQRVISVRKDATIGTAAALFRKYHIGTLPVVDLDDRLIGIVRLQGLLKLVMPDFVNLVTNFDYVHNFGALESCQPDPEQLAKNVQEITDPPACVQAEDGLIKAGAYLYEHNLRDLPVVDEENRLIGLASLVDIGVALMSNWQLPEPPLLEIR